MASEIRIIGSFATEYSLAKINRNLAFALADLQSAYKVELWGDVETIDRLPSANDLKKYPRLKEMFNPAKKHAQVAIFNNFPKSMSGPLGVQDLDADVRLAYMAWEETVFPQYWVEECNQNLHGMMVTSNHVKRVFENSGMKIPIKVVGAGINQNLVNISEPWQLKTTKKFRFLHVSSAQARKGVDVLLQSYFQTFSNKDDVVLVLKLFQNPNNNTDEQLAALARPDAPEVLIIKETELTDGQMASIFKQCQVLVGPSRAEGFGLPMAEAMLLGLAVITTNYSGQIDFCKPDNSFLIDYQLVKSTESHLGIPGARWAEPDAKQLGTTMRDLYEHWNSAEIKQKLLRASETARTLTWGSVAARVLEFVKYLESVSALKQKRLAVVTTYNTKCGIADYTSKFYPPIESSFQEVRYFANTDAGDQVFEDSDLIERTWEHGEETFQKTLEAIRAFKADFVHIQYNPPFYSPVVLGAFIEALKQMHCQVLLTIHAVAQYIDFGKYKQQLSLCDAIFIHSPDDADLLKRLGFGNIVLLHHGIMDLPDEDKTKLRLRLGLKQSPIIASHGLIHEDKGQVQLIEALALLKVDYPDMLLLCINALNPNNSTSSATFATMKQTAKDKGLEQNVIFITDFLEHQEIVTLLHAADVIALPYAEIKESASGAVRTSMGARRPVLITRSSIFADLPAGYRIDSNKPELIARGITELLKNPGLYQSELDKINAFISKYAWQTVAQEYLQIVAAL